MPASVRIARTPGAPSRSTTRRRTGPRGEEGRTRAGDTARAAARARRMLAWFGRNPEDDAAIGDGLR